MIGRPLRRRAMVGTAVGVAATASMVSNARRNRAERKAIEQQTQANEAYAAEPVYQAAPQPQAAAPAPSQMAQDLEELNDLRARGIITQEEFEAKKKQLLNL